jgi:hypothetical protein
LCREDYKTMWERAIDSVCRNRGYFKEEETVVLDIEE